MKKLLFLLLFLPLVSISQNDFKDNIKSLLADQYDQVNIKTYDELTSIRIPIITVEKGWKGWLEDRRPASNGDPYKIAGRIIKTVKSANIK